MVVFPQKLALVELQCFSQITLRSKMCCPRIDVTGVTSFAAVVSGIFVVHLLSCVSVHLCACVCVCVYLFMQ